jgi:uncharacterized membrane protein YczE
MDHLPWPLTSEIYVPVLFQINQQIVILLVCLMSHIGSKLNTSKQIQYYFSLGLSKQLSLNVEKYHVFHEQCLIILEWLEEKSSKSKCTIIFINSNIL